MPRKSEVSDLAQQVKHSPRKKAAKKTVHKFCPSGITLMDCASGGGKGIGVFGKILNIVGEESTGKTIMCCEIIAAAKNLLGKKLRWHYDDGENGFTFDSQELYGMDILDPSGEPSRTIEDFELNIHLFMESLEEDEYGIYILDSLDGLSSEAEEDYFDKKLKKAEKGEKLEKGTYNLTKQKEFSAFFRVMSNDISKKKVFLIVISQVRYKIGANLFACQWQRTGGKAMDFYAAGVCWLKVVQKHIKKGRETGNTVLAKMKKNKLWKPHRGCYFDILFDYGVDNIFSNLVFLFDLRTVKGEMKKTIKIDWDEGHLEMTLAAAVQHIEDNGLEDELSQRVVEKWNAIEESISCKDRKRRY